MPSNDSEDAKSVKKGRHAKHAKPEVSATAEKADAAPGPKHGKKEGKDKASKNSVSSVADDGKEEVASSTQASGGEGKVSSSKHGKNADSGDTPTEEAPDFEWSEDEAATGEYVEFVDAAQEVDGQKDHTKLKRGLAIGFGSFFAVLLVVYLAGVAFFADRLYPNTTLGDLDVSMQTSSDLRQTLDNRVEGYTLTVVGLNGFSQKITASEIGLTVDGSVTLSQMVPDRTALTWPVDVFLSHDISKNIATSYNLATVQSTISAVVANYNETATLPENATIAYDETKKGFKVVPEKNGTAVDVVAVSSAIANAIVSLNSRVEIGDDELLKPSIVSTDPRMSTALAQADKMSKADVSYTLADVEVAHVSAPLISKWISLDENCAATLDEEKLVAWAVETAEPLNTCGSERTYTRPDGKVVTVSGGDYGWEVDVEEFVSQVREDVSEGTTKTSAIPCTEKGTGEGFTEVGGADWGNRYVDVDLSEQYARFYDSDGSLIWEADFVSGAPTKDKATPTGVYFIKLKESPSKLVGYLANGEKDYETTVTYWMPFIRNEIGFHDATWQPGFGGSLYTQGYGSHGCINISYSDASDLYSLIHLNDVVVVHN